MIANPKEPLVTVDEGGDVREKAVSIEFDPTADGFVLMLNEIGGIRFVARSDSARALSRWAFDRGALRVRHDYDLSRLDR